MSALKVIQVPAAFNTAGLNIVWILVGLIAIYAGIKNLLDEENPSRIGTAIFWCSFGIVTALGTWLPAKVSGVLVIIMCLPPIFKKVKVGKTNAPEKAHTEAQFKKIGMKIFVPAFCVAVFSLAFSLFSNMSSMIAITLGVLVAIIFLVAYDSKENKPQVFLKDSEFPRYTVTFYLLIQPVLPSQFHRFLYQIIFPPAHSFSFLFWLQYA